MKITEEILRQFLLKEVESWKEYGLVIVDEERKVKVNPAYETGFKHGARKFKEYIDHLQKDEEECESSL